jgi:hypothetical protein
MARPIRIIFARCATPDLDVCFVLFFVYYPMDSVLKPRPLILSTFDSAIPVISANWAVWDDKYITHDLILIIVNHILLAYTLSCRNTSISVCL